MANSTKVNKSMAYPAQKKSTTPKPPGGMKGRVVQAPKVKGSPVKR